MADSPNLSKRADEDNVVIQNLMNENNNIKETQMQYGMPAIGDLFSGKVQDV